MAIDALNAADSGVWPLVAIGADRRPNLSDNPCVSRTCGDSVVQHGRFRMAVAYYNTFPAATPEMAKQVSTYVNQQIVELTRFGGQCDIRLPA